MEPDKPSARHSAFAKAVCLDLPYILDSIWRRAEFNVNRFFSYEVRPSETHGVEANLARRPYTRVPAFWFFLATLVFVAYGPTFTAWCSVVGPAGMRATRAVLGAACVVLAAAAWWRLIRYGEARAQKRFLKAPVLPGEVWRRRWVRAGVQIAVFGTVFALGQFGLFLLRSMNEPICRAVPSDAPARYQALLLIGVIGVTVWLARRPLKFASRQREQAALLLTMVLVLWAVIAPGWASEANQSPYPHTYGVFACAIALLALLAPVLARWQFGSITNGQRAMYRAALRSTELFPGSRVDPDISARRVVAALATGIFYHLLHFLLLPSLFALMVPSRYLLGTFIGCAVLAAWLLMMGNFTSRWQAMVSEVQRWFLVGTPLAVSGGVITLAILRLARVQYVTTVLDAAPFGVIFVWIVMAYVLLWWFEYSVNGHVAAELIRVIGTDEQMQKGCLKYVPDLAPPEQLTVSADHRFIVAHGAGRFAAVGWFRDKDSHQPLVAFQTFDLAELFGRLTPPALADLWHDLERRIELYFLTVNGLVVAVLLAGFFYYGYDDRHNSVAAVVDAASAADSSPGADLAALLRSHKMVFIVAASGGGTRAALFTATALEGLNRLGVAQDIVLLSGVSGGGVAEAYFYTHHDALLAPGADTEWARFKERMTEPFIGDVLAGAGEWRVLSREPLGRLLVESFERRLFNLGYGQATMGHTGQVGLILNTTVTAHPQEDSDLLRNMFAAPKSQVISCDELHFPYGMMGGGRLIFTNLTDQSAFPPSGASPPADSMLRIPDVRLPYVVVRDPHAEVASAAALNANFPPVFTNARVDVAGPASDRECPKRSYYVTDGGATENLGLLSALYALRAALPRLQANEIPDIHIVTIEASATDYDYKPDRGMDAALGGSKERLTGGLTQELLDDVQASLGARGRVRVHDLALPLAFRSRGGFGTHWMFPESIIVANPRQAIPLGWYQHLFAEWFAQDPPSAVLNQQQLTELWTSLHDSQEGFCGHDWKSEQRRVAGWICPSARLPADIHILEWHQLIESLKNK